MIYDILFAVCGIGLIALGMSLFKLDTRVEAWRVETLRHVKLLNDLDNKRLEDACRTAEAFKRIQDLEEKIKALEETVEYLENKL